MCISKENVLRWGEVKWYYDAVAEHGPDVPEVIARRVRRCLVFRKQIDRLQEAVTGAGGEANASRSKMKRDIIDTLSEHFRCLNEQVTCSRVKPFLPSLLLPAVQVRIPTPITVHLDHCPECAEDLEALRDLGLSPAQLERLERLYQAPATWDRRLCRKARSRIAAFVGGSLEGIEGELLDHLCTCARCRSRVYRSRQRLLESEASGAGQAGGPEDDVLAAELFDYAVPYERTSADVSQAGYTPVPTGRPYLRRIQELDDTLYGIAERTDSGVATVYSTIETDASPRRETVPTAASVGALGTAESYPDPYPGYPIHVQVIRNLPEQATPDRSPTEIRAVWQRATCNPRVRLILKAAVAAAAVIPLVLLFQTTNTASGITVGQMLKALGKAQNIHVSTFDPPTGRLIQEFWISRATNSLLTAEGQDRVAYDLAARKRYVYRSSGMLVETTELSESQCANIRHMIGSCLGFTLNDLPADKKWNRVDDNSIDALETYELAYTEQDQSGTIALRKLRILIDPVRKLPREVQASIKILSEEEWRHLWREEIQYLRDDEMAAVLSSR
jgi:hypothetical protein